MWIGKRIFNAEDAEEAEEAEEAIVSTAYGSGRVCDSAIPTRYRRRY
jgi:hypothetical protein